MRIDRNKVFKDSYMMKLTLLVSGLVAVGVAGTILLAPEVFYAGYGIEVEGDATLVNELKAPAGVLLAAGLLMFAGVFRTELGIGAACLVALLRARVINTHYVSTEKAQ